MSGHCLQNSMGLLFVCCWEKRFTFSFLLLAFALSASTTGSARISKPKTSSISDANYAEALAAADRFLQAWQSGDMENGMAILTLRAKQALSRENLDKLFTNEEPAGYEITRGKLLRRGRYEFPIVMVEKSQNARVRRRFSSIVVVDTGNNDWAVDKLP